MKAQVLYDLRDKTGFCDGMTLHRFFEGQVGDMSPSGHAEIDESEAVNLVRVHLSKMRYNAPSAYEKVVAEMQQLAGKMGRFAKKCI